jgi:hypothetical protein
VTNRRFDELRSRLTRYFGRRRIIAAVIVVGVGAGVSVAIGLLTWNRSTAADVERMRGATRTASPGVYSWEELASLPPPVARYFQFALAPGQLLIRGARITQRGEFARAPNAWRPFTALENFTVRPPGFVWDARIETAPLFWTRVRDSYVDGAGAIRGSIGGLISVADQARTPEMASGALLRYLAESVWLPTALLPSQGVQWSAIDARSARATLTDRGTTVSMTAYFASDGGILKISAMRYRDVDGHPLLTQWEGRFADYERVNGMRVPHWGEVGWQLADGWFPYWRATNVRWLFQFDSVAKLAR